jgi:hypothetical protein
METQKHEEVRTTTSYWGYRELTADEIGEVGGGVDFSGTGFGSHTGYGASSFTSYQSNQAALAQQRGLAVTALVFGIGHPGGADWWAAAGYLFLSFGD